MARLPRVLPAILLAIAALLPAAAPAAAADATFGTPTADVTYGTSIVFSVPFTAAGTPTRVELRLEFPGSIGPFITEIDPPAPGARSISHTLDTSGDGHIVPNTTFTATWAAYLPGAAEPVTSSSETIHYQDTTHTWQKAQGKLVTLYWYEGPESFARKALKIGEDAVAETSKLLGVNETRPIDFYVYGDETSFREAMGPGTRENVGGRSYADIRTMFALLTPSEIDSSWVGIVIPHELTHLVFDSAVSNPYRFPPRWLNEGLATYLSAGYTGEDRITIESADRSGDLLPLTAMGGQFPTDAQKTYLAYSESVSAIDYLVRTYSKASLLALVAAYKEGLTDDEAFSKVLGVDLAGFQAGWIKDLGVKTPTQYGPQPEPPGPVPPGWDQALPTAAPGGSPGATGAAPAPSGAAATSSPGEPGGSTTGAGTSGTVALVVVSLVMVVLVLWLVRSRRGRPAA